MLSFTASGKVSEGHSCVHSLMHAHTLSTVCVPQTELIFCHCALSPSAYKTKGMYVLLFQKLKDNREQVIKKRKKKEVNNVEEKNPKKNKVPKQG